MMKGHYVARSAWLGRRNMPAPGGCSQEACGERLMREVADLGAET